MSHLVTFVGQDKSLEVFGQFDVLIMHISRAPMHTYKL